MYPEPSIFLFFENIHLVLTTVFLLFTCIITLELISVAYLQRFTSKLFALLIKLKLDNRVKSHSTFLAKRNRSQSQETLFKLKELIKVRIKLIDNFFFYFC